METCASNNTFYVNRWKLMSIKRDQFNLFSLLFVSHYSERSLKDGFLRRFEPTPGKTFYFHYLLFPPFLDLNKNSIRIQFSHRAPSENVKNVTMQCVQAYFVATEKKIFACIKFTF